MVCGCLERTVLESLSKSVAVRMEDLMRGCCGVWGQVTAWRWCCRREHEVVVGYSVREDGSALVWLNVWWRWCLMPVGGDEGVGWCCCA